MATVNSITSRKSDPLAVARSKAIRAVQRVARKAARDRLLAAKEARA